MGYLTTIILYNDALPEFKKHPTELSTLLFQGIDEAYSKGQAIDVGFRSYANYIKVHPSRHADDTTLYLHSGNTVFNIGSSNDMRDLIDQNPELAKKWLGEAQKILWYMKKQLKDKQNEKDH